MRRNDAVAIALVGWALLFTGSGFSQPAPATAPATKALRDVAKDAATAVSQYDVTIAKLREEYAERAKAAQNQLLKKLDTDMSVETKKGNLEGALAIRAEIAAQKQASLAMNPIGFQSSPQGVWHLRYNASEVDMRFDKNRVTNLTHEMTTTVTRLGPSIVMQWPNGWIDRMTPVGDRLLLENWDPQHAPGFPDAPCTGFGIGTSLMK